MDITVVRKGINVLICTTNNKYQGPKPRGLRDASGSSTAGAATVIAATSLAGSINLSNAASSIHPSDAEANSVSSFPNAPQEVEPHKSVKGDVSAQRTSC